MSHNGVRILREQLPKLAFLQTSLIIHCERGGLIIDATNDSRYKYVLDQKYSVKEWQPSYLHYKPTEVDLLIGYVGAIQSITLLNHDNDDETVLL